jgi:hypothetical protein
VKTIIRVLQQSISSPHYCAEFARGVGRHPALAFCRCAQDVLGALAAQSQLSHGERNDIVRALVLEKRAGPHPLWPALLLLAFEPAMWRLRRRLSKSGLDDLDALIMASLVGAAETVRTDGHAVVLRIHRAMVRAVLKHAMAKHPDATDEELPEAPQASIPWYEDQEPFVHCAAREVLRVSASIPGATAAVFARAGFVGVSVVAEGEPSLSAKERRAVRHRSYAKNRRALVRLRMALAKGDTGE